MAFLRYARARVVEPRIQQVGWEKVRTAAKASVMAENLVDQASEIFGSPFDPSKYLLTHATIVASVDTYAPPGVKVGAVIEDGHKVNRKFADYRVTPETEKYVNNNYDSWSRGVLAKAYKTFIGGHNFLEHVQIETLSKGRIIDAVLRDVGDSLYVDILIATDRKHASLCRDIESGEMSTLSMGCTIDASQCTKCGHWAADETESCDHIKYEKGNTFIDEAGRPAKVAELCGHESIDPTGGVTFIEASWVKTPAFTGAVMRNVLIPTIDTARQIEAILSQPPAKWDATARTKAASGDPDHVREILAEDWDAGGADDAAPAAPAAPDKKSPMKDVEDDVYQHILERARKRIRDDLDKDDPQPSSAPTEMDTNDSIVREASQKRLASERYRAGLNALVRTASTDIALVDSVARYNDTQGIQIPVPIYRAALSVGPQSRYGSLSEYLGACHRVLGRSPDKYEAMTMVRISKLLAQRDVLAGGGNN